jgi:nucleoside-diphosphate-sugar epimerase
MRIFITGYMGYLGSVLVPMLLAEGHTVFGVDSELFKRCVFYKPQVEIPSLKADIRDLRVEDLYGFDAVIHLAGLSNDPLGDVNPKATYDVNYTAAVQVASLAKYADVPRFLLSSSCAVYGNATSRYVNETSPLNPLTTFAKAKVNAEHDIGLLADAGFSPTFLRKPTMYGMSPYHRTDTVVNNLVAWAVVNQRVMLKTDGQSWRPLGHVEDVARAFVAALSAPRHAIHHQAFNVCHTEDNYSVQQIADVVRSVLPNVGFEYMTNASRDERSYRVDGSKLTRTLPDWQPQWTLQDGIQQLAAAYRDKGVTLDDFEGPRYKRVAYLKYLLANDKLDMTLRWETRKAQSVGE